MVVKTSLQWTVLVVCRAQWLSDTVLHFALYPWGIIKKVWMSPPSSCASFQLIAHFLMLMVLGWG